MRALGIECGRAAAGMRASYRSAKLPQAIVSPAEELDEPDVAEHLELLADFVSNVAILGVKPSEAFLERVSVAQIKLRLAQ